ncbi:hypothetical protein LC087_14295 [Bacillus carboniphilus]|uniref:CtsR C-terminal dimerization domain-containing protein n=1 Tax=Bacillus carboniphilus TaxID=86663 RepID=A0ABY9JT08_9BACI|nr:hypothetical protein [Bacillus carboniphilus]WLR41954.1 hypothetical protein LC087_14295 [Bacillus carboniphilus]
MKAHDHAHLLSQLIDLIGNHLTQAAAENIILRMIEEKVVTEREARLMLSVIDRSVLYLGIPERDEASFSYYEGDASFTEI